MSAPILVVDANPRTGEWLRQAVGDIAQVIHVPSVAAAFEAIGVSPPSLLIIGEQIQDSDPNEFLHGLRLGGLLDVGHNVMFIGDHRALKPAGEVDDEEAPPAVGEEAEDEDEHTEAPVFFVLPPTLSAERIRMLVLAAIAPEQLVPPSSGAAIEELGDPHEVQAILEASRRMAVQKEPSGAAQVAATAAMDFTEADRGYFYFYDHDSGMLFSGDEDDPRESVASTTLAGFAVRTKLPLFVEHAGSDPLWVQGFDDPDGTGDSRLAFQPIADATGEAHAVIIVAREARRPPFTPEDVRGLAALAESFGPSMQLLSLQVEADNQVDDEIRARQPGQGMFSEEAQEAYRSMGRQGDVVRITPQWMIWLYRALLAMLATAAVFVNVAHVAEYAVGPAVIFLTGRVEVTSRVSGTVGRIIARPGEKVEGGEVLVEMYSADERAELDRLRLQYEADVITLLTNPSDEAARRSVAVSAASREQAKQRLEAKTIRAPFDGRVGDLRVRTGQPVEPGQQVISLLRDDSEVSVVAFIPGNLRPNLKVGQRMNLHISGYEDARPQLRIEHVGEEIVGPQEASRYLPMRLADSVAFPGPVVLVSGRLKSRMFEHRGATYHLHDGMQARAEVAVRTRSILRALAPSLDDIGQPDAPAKAE